MFADAASASPVNSLPALIRALTELGPELARRADDVDALLRSVTLDGASLEPYLFRAERRYTRTLLHRSPDFELLLLRWPKGCCAPVHDHAGQRCWLVPLRGSLEVQNYRVVDSDRARGYAWLEPSEPPREVGPGEFVISPDGGEIHGVRNHGDVAAVSLHLYAGPIDACGVYDLRRKRVKTRLLRYDQIGPNPRPTPADATTLREAERDRLSPPTPSRLRSLARGAAAVLRRAGARVRPRTPLLAEEALVSDASAQLTVKTLQHTYANKVQVLRNVSLNVRSGDFVCLVGPSGCGKTTLLYALAGHIRPTGGTVSLDGRPVIGPGPDRLLMFQEPGLFPWLTVEGNIVFALGTKGLPRGERRRRARRYLELVQLGGFEKARPHELSGGMRMRASLARALAMESDVLLMDEPFGSLDAQTKEDMHVLLQSIWRETRKTIVFVTHDLREALTLSNRLVVMAPRPGRIVRDLEIRLPFPRDPDSSDLASLARQVKALFLEHAPRTAAEAGSRAPQQEESDEASSTMDLQHRLHGRIDLPMVDRL